MPPKSPKNPQWRLRLDRYHRWVVYRFKELWEADKSAVLERFIVQWVGDHQDQLDKAGASLDRWREVMDTWTDADEKDDD